MHWNVKKRLDQNQSREIVRKLKIFQLSVYGIFFWNFFENLNVIFFKVTKIAIFFKILKIILRGHGDIALAPNPLFQC